MKNDTVREELQTKITAGPPVRFVPKPEAPTLAPTLAAPPAAAPAPRRVETADLVAPKTSPTLVGFQNKEAPLPDWRLQIQNAVKQRRNGDGTGLAPAPIVRERAEADAEPMLEVPIADPRVANAMKRIAQSRTTFHKPKPFAQRKPVRSVQNPVQKPFPFDVVGTSTATAARPAPITPRREPELRPGPPPVVENKLPLEEKRDTNKLPRVETIVGSPDDEVDASQKPEARVMAAPAIKRIQIRVTTPGVLEEPDVQHEEEPIDDLAPISMRFGAGLFDVIIGAFGALLMISPLAFSSTGDWFTASGILLFAAAWALFLFVYMTASLGIVGKTIGMRLFSLELIDSVENEYPTLRQAAVNSAVFILAMPLAGAAFIPAFFNEEQRALHDLMSGTILVKEF